ncbi:MAG: DUF2279 domain-containing protein [Bacteroidota bacterium]
MATGIGAGWAGSMTGLYLMWYKKEDQTTFHSFNDTKEWLQMDKVGHFYTAWKISELSTNSFRWTGLDSNWSLLTGCLTGWGYQATLEVFDGFSTEWGFSWGDMTANTLGSGLYATQELIWKEQRFLPKFSSFPSQYAKYRPEMLGSTVPERILKDYNGQTYWLSFSPGTFMKNSNYPEWLCFSFGYSIDARLKGNQDVYQYTGNLGATSFDSNREWLFSLDVDFSKIKVKKPWLKMVLKQVNHLKVPFPALMLSNKKLQFKPFYF